MFSNTAYEAMYEYLGLALHSKFIEVITSQKVFLGLVVLIFGVTFFITVAQFFSRYIPGVIVARKNIPLSKFVRVIFFLFLGISILKIGSSTGVKRFNGESWHENSYIHGQIRSVEPQYQVSLLFDLMSRTAEETAAVIARVIDDLFQTTNSQLEAPNFFFKAIMYGAANTIEDKNLRITIHTYTNECFDRVLPLVQERAKQNKLDGFFADNDVFDRRLSMLPIQTGDRVAYTCLDLKNELRSELKTYVLSRPRIGPNLDSILKGNAGINQASFENYQISNFLINEYHTEHEGMFGIQKGSAIPTTGGRIVQYFNRITSFDGFLSIFSNGQLQGAWSAATRSQEFSDNLARAPHIAGFIKMCLIAVFPWLLFFVIAGHWRVLTYWWLMYFSVLLWTPIWALLYHIMASIALSADTMEAFGKLNDGISLYGAELISSRIYHLFAVYSWLQLLVGVGLTGWAAWNFRPILSDSQSDESLDYTGNVTKGAGSAAVSGATKAVGALL